MASITVVTACYNSSRFIRETIASVINQDLYGWEYVLVDDGSTDSTPGIIAHAASTDPRVKLIRQQNLGTCNARNRGASRCSPESKYLLFLDHDDMLEPNALRILSDYLNASDDVCVAACQFQEINENGEKFGSHKRRRWVPSLFSFPRPLRANEHDTPFVAFYCGTGQGPFAMFRRSAFERVAGWTTEFWPYEDSDLFCKLALIGKIHYLPQRLYLKRVHQHNALNDAERLTQAYRAFRRKWDNYQPQNAREEATLEAAAAFYRTSFRPFRHLRVGCKALLDLLQHPSIRRLRWALHLFRHGLSELVTSRLPGKGNAE